MAMSKVPPDSDDLKRVNARIPTELYNHLVNTAQVRGESMAAYLSSVVKADADRMTNDEQRLDDACKRLLESGNTETLAEFDKALITAAIATAKAKADTVSAQADIKLAEARRAKAQADKDELDVAAQALDLARTAEYHNVRGDIDKAIAAGLTDIGLSDSTVQQVRSFAEARALERMAAVDRQYADWIGKLGPKKLDHQEAQPMVPVKEEHFSPSGKRVLTPKIDQEQTEPVSETVEKPLENTAPASDEADTTVMNSQENDGTKVASQPESEVLEHGAVENSGQPESGESAEGESSDEGADTVDNAAPMTNEQEPDDLADSIFEESDDSSENTGDADDAGMTSVPAVPPTQETVPGVNSLVQHVNMNGPEENQVPAGLDYTAQPENTDSLSNDMNNAQTMSDESQSDGATTVAPSDDNKTPLTDTFDENAEQGVLSDANAEADASAEEYAHSIFGD